MTNTTDIFWEADGVSLQTYTQNIESFGGRDTPPKLRGDDITIPFMEGQLWVPKVADSRVLQLGMWCRGETRDEYQTNWRALRNLLFRPGRQFTLTKRIKIADTILVLDAKAEFSDGLEPSMLGPKAGRFTVSLKLAGAWFFDRDYRTINLVSGDQNVTVAGDVATRNILITMQGTRSNPKVNNKTLGVQVQYNGTLNVGDTTVLDNMAYRAMHTVSGGSAQRVNASILHSGSPQWMWLDPDPQANEGVNVINLSGSDAGIGGAVLQYKGAFL